MPQPTPKLTLNLNDGSVAVDCTVETVRELQAELQALMQRLKLACLKATSPEGNAKTRPVPQAPMEYRHVGQVFLEVFCNPNLWATPFAAKVLITIRDERIRLTVEVSLSRLLDDVTLFLEAAD